jgi:DNA repair protein RadC
VKWDDAQSFEAATPPRTAQNIPMTQSILEIAKPLGISVYDHIIVGEDGHASLKGLKPI